MTLHRYTIFCFDEISFPWLTYTETNKFWIKRQICKWMESTYDDVKDPEVRKRLIPTYEIGCKRITPHPNYAKTFNKPNVRLVTNRIEEITKGGISTEHGKHHDLDTIIYATGFDIVKSVNSFKMTGAGGMSYADVTGDAPAAMNGVVVPNFPNFFILNGPNTALGHNSVIFMIECQSIYITSCIRRLIEAEGKSIDCRPVSMSKWLNYIYAELNKKVWTSGCTSYHRNEKGVVHTIWPNNAVEYWWRLLQCDMADFKLRD